MDALIPSMSMTPTPQIPGGMQPRGTLSDLVRPQGLSPMAVPDVSGAQFTPGMTTMGLPRAEGKQSIAALSAGSTIAPGAGADVAYQPTGATPGQVIAENLPKTLQQLTSGGEPAGAQTQNQAGLGGIVEKIGSAAKSFFDSPGTNLSSSSAVGSPAGGMEYQTPFFSTQSTYISGSTGPENSNKMLETWNPINLVANYLGGG